MSLLTSVTYDPVTAQSKATSSLLAMTALDTTNLRTPSFTVPANGSVLCRIRANTTGATTFPQILLGVLDGATVRGRAAPRSARTTALATAMSGCEASFLVTGMTPGASKQFDAAYGVEFAVASTNIKYGGPDDTSTNNSFGACLLEVWDAAALLAGTHCDPSTVTNSSVAAATAMTALDTTNLRLTFTAPASGNVMVRMRGVVHGSTSAATVLFGVLDGATIKARHRTDAVWNTPASGPAATDHLVQQSRFTIQGLTPSASYTWDAAMGSESAAASGNLSWGGPDNTSQDDAYGGFAYEIWDAGGVSAPSTLMIGQVI